MKFAYCGYDFFAGCLEALLSSGHELMNLYSWPTDNEYDFNSRLINLAALQKSEITLSKIHEKDIDRLVDNGCEMLITAAYPYKIPRNIVRMKYHFNIHPSPLPIGRGPWPLPWIILKNYRQSSVVFHKISPQWDGGDILAKFDFEVNKDENLESLSIKSQIIAKNEIVKFMSEIEFLWNQAKRQGDGEYWSMPERSHRTVDWNSSVDEIDRIVRAFGKFDSRAVIDGVDVWIQDVKTWKTPHNFMIGSVAHRASREIVLAAGDGLVAIRYWKEAKK